MEASQGQRRVSNAVKKSLDTPCMVQRARRKAYRNIVPFPTLRTKAFVVDILWLFYFKMRILTGNRNKKGCPFRPAFKIKSKNQD